MSYNHNFPLPLHPHPHPPSLDDQVAPLTLSNCLKICALSKFSTQKNLQNKQRPIKRSEVPISLIQMYCLTKTEV